MPNLTYTPPGVGFLDSRYLRIANDLSDLDNVATARTNLGLVAGAAGDIWIEKAGDTMAGALFIQNTLTITSNNELRFADNGNYVGFEAPALSANQIWVLPAADGNASEFLQTDGNGVLAWAAGGSGSPGGANTQVQFNDSGSFGGDAGFTYNDVSNTITLAGDLGLTGTRVTKGWFTNVESTNMYTVGGTSIQTTFDARYVELVGDQIMTGQLRLTPAADGTQKLLVNNAAAEVVFNVDTTNKFVGVQTLIPVGELHVASTSTTNADRGITSAQHSDTVHGALLRARKSRGTEASPSTVANGDIIGQFDFFAYGNAWTNRATVSAVVRGTVNVNSVPTDILFKTGSTAATEAMRITSDKKVGIGGIPVSQFDVITSGEPGAATRGINISQHNDGAQGVILTWTKSRGTKTSPTIVVDGDFGGLVLSSFYDGADYLSSAGFGFRVNGTVASGSIPVDFIISAGSVQAGSLNSEVLRAAGVSSRIGIGDWRSDTIDARLHVQGASDEIQFIVQANATQNEDIVEVQASGGQVNWMIDNEFTMTFREITTPTADTNFGKLYTKTDNKLYFQDGAGVEHEVAFV